MRLYSVEMFKLLSVSHACLLCLQHDAGLLCLQDCACILYVQHYIGSLLLSRHNSSLWLLSERKCKEQMLLHFPVP